LLPNWGKAAPEFFCYLKIADIENIPTDDILEVREKIEGCFNAPLLQVGVGCVIGGGWGPHFPFVDLALTDVNAAIPLLRQISTELELSCSTWLRFLDSKYNNEWVGMYPDTPEPDLSPDW
jgi:hypothetical protein